jgi:hypothetical protein
MSEYAIAVTSILGALRPAVLVRGRQPAREVGKTGTSEC